MQVYVVTMNVRLAVKLSVEKKLLNWPFPEIFQILHDNNIH